MPVYFFWVALPAIQSNNNSVLLKAAVSQPSHLLPGLLNAWVVCLCKDGFRQALRLFVPRPSPPPMRLTVAVSSWDRISWGITIHPITPVVSNCYFPINYRHPCACACASSKTTHQKKHKKDTTCITGFQLIYSSDTNLKCLNNKQLCTDSRRLASRQV